MQRFRNIMKLRKKRGKKAVMAIRELLIWLLAILGFVVILFAIIIFVNRGTGAIDYIKELFRFGR